MYVLLFSPTCECINIFCEFAYSNDDCLHDSGRVTDSDLNAMFMYLLSIPEIDSESK